MKKIMLGDLLEYIDPICTLVVWYNDPDMDDKDEPAFEGAAMDTPFWLTKMYLVDPKDNDGDGTIDSRILDSKSMRVGMIIVVEEKED